MRFRLPTRNAGGTDNWRLSAALKTYLYLYKLLAIVGFARAKHRGVRFFFAVVAFLALPINQALTTRG